MLTKRVRESTSSEGRPAVYEPAIARKIFFHDLYRHRKSRKFTVEEFKAWNWLFTTKLNFTYEQKNLLSLIVILCSQGTQLDYS